VALFWFCLLLVVALDQAAKYLVAAHMWQGQSLPLIEGLVYATYVMNKGAAFSILQGQRWLFLATTPVVLAVILWYMRGVSKSDRLIRIALALFCGGALGNYIDRLRFGAVTDFIDFRFFPVFNVADSCIVVGVIILGWCLFFRAKKDDAKDDI
jgi:signal peptidase II